MKLFQTNKSNYLYDEFTNNIVNIGVKRDLSQSEIKKIRIELENDGVFKKCRKMKFMPKQSISGIMAAVSGNMEHLILCITNQCNFRCGYCIYSGRYQHQRNHEDVFMGEKVATQAIEFFFQHAANKNDLIIGFYGGEPLINFKVVRASIEKCILLGKGKNLSFSLTTNGYLLTEKIISELKQFNIKIYVSYDGPEEIQDKWRRTLNNLDSSNRVLKNLAKIKEKHGDFYKNNIIIQPTITPPYPINKINYYFLTNELFIDNLVIPNFVHSVGMVHQYKVKKREIKKNLIEALSFFVNCVKEGNFSKSKIHNNIWAPSLKKIHNRVEYSEDIMMHHNGICIPSQNRIFVSPDGKLRICEKLDSFTEIGSIYTGVDYNKVLQIYNKYVDDIEKRCINCWAKSFCDLCFFSVAGENGLDFGIKKEYCQSKRKDLESTMNLYLTLFEIDPNILENITQLFK